MNTYSIIQKHKHISKNIYNTYNTLNIDIKGGTVQFIYKL